MDQQEQYLPRRERTPTEIRKLADDIASWNNLTLDEVAVELRNLADLKERIHKDRQDLFSRGDQ
jgi:hypothetical protein